MERILGLEQIIVGISGFFFQIFGLLAVPHKTLKIINSKPNSKENTFEEFSTFYRAVP